MAFPTRALRGSPRGPRAESGGVGPLDVIDTALCLALRRELFTREEACELLAGVQNKVHGEESPGPELADLIATAVTSFGEGALVERARLVDALLDLRLVIGR